jgi:hypothetical protein
VVLPAVPLTRMAQVNHVIVDMTALAEVPYLVHGVIPAIQRVGAYMRMKLKRILKPASSL